MLDFKTYLVNTMINDATLRGLLGAPDASHVPVFPTDIDIQPEQFPSITYGDVANLAKVQPIGMHVGVIQLDVWSTLSAYQAESIYERLDFLFNFKDSTTQTITGILWWVREQNARDMHEASRRLFHKQIDYKYWANRANNT